MSRFTWNCPYSVDHEDIKHTNERIEIEKDFFKVLVLKKSKFLDIWHTCVHLPLCDCWSTVCV